MSISVRLDPETEALLNHLAQTQQRTKSDIIRAALKLLAQDEQNCASQPSPYALVADLIGIAQGGPDNLAQNHKQAFRDVLIRKHRFDERDAD